MSNKETIEKAYSNFNKEVPGYFNWDWIPSKRTFTYCYLKLVRYLSR